MTNARLLSTLNRLQDFIERKSPFHEPHMLELDMEPDAYEQYRTHWLAEREFFRAETRSDYPTWNCLRDWAERHKEALLDLPHVDQVELAVWAAGTFQDALLDVFLDADVDFHLVRDSGGDLPLHAAAACQSILLFPRLMDCSWTACHTLNAAGQTPIQVLVLARDAEEDTQWPVRFGQGKHTHCLRSVAAHDRSLLTRPFPDGNTALHLAASLAQPMSACKIIVEAGGAWNQPNREGVTPAQVLESNPLFTPDPTSKNPERRREARYREAAMEQGRVPRAANPAPQTPARTGFLSWFKRR